MRPLELKEKKALYRLTKTTFAIFGIFLLLLGCWFLTGGLLDARSTIFWLGLLPAYVGSMLLLFSLAMRIEWFTDTRRFW
jgi:hypothetical protein